MSESIFIGVDEINNYAVMVTAKNLKEAKKITRDVIFVYQFPFNNLKEAKDVYLAIDGEIRLMYGWNRVKFNYYDIPLSTLFRILHNDWDFNYNELDDNSNLLEMWETLL